MTWIPHQVRDDKEMTMLETKVQTPEDQYKQWIALNVALVSLSEDMAKKLESILFGHLDVLIINTFLIKGIRCLKSIILLSEKELWEPAIPIARVLIEHRITFDYFLQMLASDSKGTCHKFMDSSTLDMIKQQKSVDFHGLEKIKSGPQKDKLIEEEKVIAGKYGKEEFKLMKQHGFTGLSVEKRAFKTGHQAIYNYMYRHFSGSVHPGDWMYYDPPSSTLEEFVLNQLSQSRKNAVQYYAHWSVAGIAMGTNDTFDLGFVERLSCLAKKCFDLSHRQNEDQGNK